MGASPLDSIVALSSWSSSLWKNSSLPSRLQFGAVAPRVETCHFAVGLKALKAGKVSDAVIKVMMNPAPPPAPMVVAATAITNDPNLPPPEVGAYWKDGQNFVL